MNACPHGQRTIRPAAAVAAAAALAVVAACGGDGGGADGDAPGASSRADRTGAQTAAGSNQAASSRAERGETAPSAGARDVALGTFTANVPEDAEDTQGRLPARGDAAIYVPATTLFPGAARLRPDVPNPYSGDAEAIAAGGRHFAAFNCAGCHAPLGGGGMGPPLSDDAWIYGSEPAQIYMSIMHGRPEGMPAWSSMLPRRTTWELVAYIETLDEIDDYAAEKGFDSGTRFAGDEGGGDGAGSGGGAGGGGGPDQGISIRSDSEAGP